jgi:hypothetical protein
MSEMTVAEHNEQLILQKRALIVQAQELRRGLFALANVAADDKDKIRVPKSDVDHDVVDVQWKVLKAGSVVFTVIRGETDGG